MKGEGEIGYFGENSWKILLAFLGGQFAVTLLNKHIVFCCPQEKQRKKKIKQCKEKIINPLQKK